MHDILHGLAIKKHVDAAALAHLTGLAPDRVTALLERAVATGRAVLAQGKYLLTPAGRMILEGQYGRYCASARNDAGFVAAYDRFELINADLKQIITDWQTLTVGGAQVANDHSDGEYDERCLDRLSAVHERLAPVLRTFAVHSDRFSRYGALLDAALDKAEDGARERVADATIESYHTVWFEMHEDLLRMLDRERDE
jgi:hypothetical protein